VTTVWPPKSFRDRLVARGRKRLCTTDVTEGVCCQVRELSWIEEIEAAFRSCCWIVNEGQFNYSAASVVWTYISERWALLCHKDYPIPFRLTSCWFRTYYSWRSLIVLSEMWYNEIFIPRVLKNYEKVSSEKGSKPDSWKSNYNKRKLVLKRDIQQALYYNRKTKEKSYQPEERIIVCWTRLLTRMNCLCCFLYETVKSGFKKWVRINGVIMEGRFCCQQ